MNSHPMTTKELLALVGKAAELPWETLSGEVYSRGNDRVVADRPDFHTTPTGYGQWAANAALIVAAVNALPALLARLEACERDAERYRWLRDSHHNSLGLSRNDDHACNYMTAAQWIEEGPDWYADNTEEEKKAMADANTIWKLQIYPDTPIGFYVWNAATLDAVIDAAIDAAKEPK